MNRTVSLILFLVLVLSGGFVLGFLTVPGEWYADLRNPPSIRAWLFGPFWTVLYSHCHSRLAYLAARPYWINETLVGSACPQLLVDTGLLCRSPDRHRALHYPAAARCHPYVHRRVLRQDRLAWLFAPYAVWVAFASILNAAIFALN